MSGQYQAPVTLAPVKTNL